MSKVKNKNINQRDENGKRHGYWIEYWYNGLIMFMGTYNHDKPHGYCEQFWSNGRAMYKGNYHHGKPIGYWEHYNWEHYNRDTEEINYILYHL